MPKKRKPLSLGELKQKYNLPDGFIAHLRPSRTSVKIGADPMPQDSLITEIAYATSLKKSDVKAVIEALGDIVLRESVINGTVKVPNIFTIESKFYKPAASYIEDMNAVVQYPPKMRLVIDIASSIKEAYKWARQYELFNTFNTNADNYLQKFIIEGNISPEEFHQRKTRGEFPGVTYDKSKNLKYTE